LGIMAPCTGSWVRDYTRVIAVFHAVTFLCVIYVSENTLQLFIHIIQILTVLVGIQNKANEITVLTSFPEYNKKLETMIFVPISY